MRERVVGLLQALLLRAVVDPGRVEAGGELGVGIAHETHGDLTGILGGGRLELVDVPRREAQLELDRRYRTATLTYTWRNGYRDGYPLFSAGDGGSSPALIAEPAISWRELTEEALVALPGRRITTDLDGRIVRVEAAAQ